MIVDVSEWFLLLFSPLLERVTLRTSDGTAEAIIGRWRC